MTADEWADAPENIDPTDIGARVVLVSTTDPHTRLAPHDTGIVQSVDGAGTVHVAWDPDGHVLWLIPGADRWRRVHPRWYDSQFEPIPSELGKALDIDPSQRAVPGPGARIRLSSNDLGTSLGRDASGAFLVYADSGALVRPIAWEEV